MKVERSDVYEFKVMLNGEEYNELKLIAEREGKSLRQAFEQLLLEAIDYEKVDRT